MDNTKDPNQPNNPFPPTQPQPTPTPPPFPNPTPNPIQPASWPSQTQTEAQPNLTSSPWLQPQTPIPAPDPIAQANPTPSPWTPPIPTPTPDPISLTLTPSPTEVNTTPIQTETTNPWGTIPTMPLTPEPAPAFPPIPTPQFQPEPESTQPATSPLDNPWSSPSQVPPLDGNSSGGIPTWLPDSQTNNIQPTFQSISNMPPTPDPIIPIQTEPASPSIQADTAPTDLSHLLGNNPPLENTFSNSTTPETLVVPPINTTADMPTVPFQKSSGIPKWLIGVGIGLLIIVAGTSAYFILGWGQLPKTTTSLPATQTTPAQVRQTPPVATPIPETEQPTATSSGSFGSIVGTAPASTPQATSAADILKQRQGR